MSDSAPDPRSPRLAPAEAGDDGDNNATPAPSPGGSNGTANANPNPTTDATAPLLPPPVTFVADPPHQRPNVGNMLFLAAFWFFMSSNNPAPPMMSTGPDGEIILRQTTLDRARDRVAEYSYFLNGTTPLPVEGGGEGGVGSGNGNGNGTEVAAPVWADPRTAVQPSAITPARYQHDPSADFYRNITGFYREAKTHVVDLTHTPAAGHEGFWHHVRFPTLNGTGVGDEAERYNETLAKEMRGDFDWLAVDKWDMNLREKLLKEPEQKNGAEKDGEGEEWYDRMLSQVVWGDWAWVKGSATVYAHSDPATISPTQTADAPGNDNNDTLTITDEEDSINYEFIGLHYIPTGSYALFGMPDGRSIDIRNIPRLFTDRHEAPVTGHASHAALLNASRAIVMRQLKADLQEAEDSLLLSDVPHEEETRTACPLLIHLSAPPLPPGLPKEQYDAYEDELEHPTGILPSLPRPPAYWQTLPGLAGIVVADGCGVAIGFDRGKGVEMADFWNSSVHYATLATFALLTSIILLVRQMELTRTPSALAKVSVFTIGMPCIMDSWLFSAHLIFGLVSDNKASLPLLVPGFLSLLSAIVFGPRYAVQLWRIQAPERMPPPPPRVQPPPAPAARADAEAAGEGDLEAGLATPSVAPPRPAAPSGPSRLARIRDSFENSPRLTFLLAIGITWLAFQFILAPSILPFFMFALYSFWVPQIYRCATRGSSSGMDKVFILGTAGARLVLPLYILAYPENILFVKPVGWIWLLVAWQGLQVLVLLAQERFGPCFFLPASYQPAESYNYHPIFPSTDVENPSTSPKLGTTDESKISLLTPDDSTCSICMEHVDTSPASSGLAGEALAGLGLGNLDKRRSYALAPCGHLFHTACLAQWMGVKTICPLCKRPLPPL